MKNLILIPLLFFALQLSFAQKSFDINSETIELTSITDGDVDLFYSITNRQYRYFVRTKDGSFYELLNTKNDNGKFDKNYISILKKVAPNSDISTDKVKLTNGSLKRFIDSHNKNSDVNYDIRDTNLKINFRLALFGGITNHPLVNLADNKTALQVAAELELFGDTQNPLHSGLLQARQTFGSDGDYTSTEFSLGYRIRVVKKEKFNLYLQNRFASVNIFSVDRTVVNGTTTSVQNQNESEFDIPFIFGIGADIKISNNSYISLLYDRFYAFGLDNSNDFPGDFMIGYKFNL